MSWPNPRLVVVVLLVLVLVEVLLPCDRRGGILLVGADRSVAFECTPRQEAEDLQAIAEEEYRYHGAMVRLGVCALQQNTAAKEKEGRQWLEKAAALGDPEAKNNLAIMYARGGVAELPRDPRRAHDLYLEAAEDGCADAMHNLGIMYDSGRGGVVKADAAAAAHWFFQAAEKNHFEATHALALMEVEGRGVDKDLARARRRFKKLAKPEVNPPYPNAHYMIGVMELQDAMRQLQGGGRLEAAVAEVFQLGSGSGSGSGSGGGSGSKSTGSAVKQKDFDEYDEDDEDDDDDDVEEMTPVEQLRYGLDMLRAARDMGHPQAKDQLDAFESAIPKRQ